MTCVVCDKCGKPIPYVKKKNILGIEEYVLDRGTVRSSEWQIDTMFYKYDLCKSCADNISLQADNLFLRMKLAVLKEANKNE
nr:MAG TPA: Protein kinase, zinc finger, kinetoplastid, KKT2.87A [Caudoviricetes sp.]